MKFKKNFVRLKGDASSRIFYRNKNKNLSSILVYAKKDKKLNLLIYDAINKILLENNILAPKLLSENYSKNYIEIEDFGDQTIFNLLKKSRTNKLVIFKRIIRLLNKLQLIRQRKIKDFKKKIIRFLIIIQKFYLKRQNFFQIGMLINIQLNLKN